MMVTIEDLDEKNDDYDAEEAQELWALYEGGKAFEKKLDHFLPQNDREPYKVWQLRKKYAEYRNYTGSIIKHFSDILFTSKPVAAAFKIDEKGNRVKTSVNKNTKDPQTGETVTETVYEVKPEVEVDPYWSSFREDCDRGGTDVDAFFKKSITEAMVKGKSWIALRQPDDGQGEATNRKDFENRKLGDIYISHLDYESVYDWENDDSGNLQWVISHSLKTVRAGIGSKRDIIVETWTHYTSESIDTYRIQYKRNERPENKEPVRLVSSSPHSLGVCPVVCLYLEPSYQVAAVLKSPAVMNFRLVSAQNWSLVSSCFAQPVAKVNDPAEFSKMMIGAGYGVVIGIDEEWGWEAPEGIHYGGMEERISDNKDEIHRLAFQMALGVENNAAAVGRTAESKSQDAQSTRVAMTAYGRIVKQTIEKIYDLIASARGDNLDWDIKGLDDFAGIDTVGLIAMAMELNSAGGIPSPTWNAEFKKKLAEAMMPDIDEAVKQTIIMEIEEAVRNAPDPADKELEIFAKQHAIVAGEDPSALVAPQTKANATKNKGGTKPFGGPKPKTPTLGGTKRTGEFVKAKKPGGK